MDALDAFVEIEKYSHLLLGRLAIEEGFITYQQLLEGLEIQHRKPERKLGSILIKKGYISSSDVNRILNLQKKLKSQKPRKWEHIPDTVLKGLFYFAGYSVGKAKIADIRKAEEMRREYRQKLTAKPLGNILAEDFKLVSIGELRRLQWKIEITQWQCSNCERLYSLFNYDPEQKIPCPICWEFQLGLYRGPEKVEEVSNEEQPAPADTSPEKPPKERKPEVRVSSELLDMYEALQEMLPISQESQSSTKTPVQAKVRTQEKSPIERKPVEKTPVEKTPVEKTPVEKTPVEGKQSIPKAMGATARIQLQQIYQQIEEKIEDEGIPQEKVARASGKKSRAAAISCVKYERDIRLRKIYIVSTIIIGLAGLVFLIVFYKGLGIGGTVTREQSTPIPTPAVSANQTTLPIPIHKMPELKDAYTFEVNILQRLYRTPKPSQMLFNELLKEIYSAEKDKKYLNSPLRGDIYNLTGRLYYYKIYIDRKDKLCEPNLLDKKNWKKIWKEKALEAFEKAKKNYQSPNAKTAINYFILDWMPERSQAIDSTYVKYNNVQEAISDIEKWVNMVKISK